jgi:flagellar hook-length control protein FliK
MTVVPIPIAPAPPNAQPAPASDPPAPGFAQALSSARGKSEQQTSGTKADKPADDACEPATGALSDATVIALLAALGGVTPKPAPTPTDTPTPVPTATETAPTGDVPAPALPVATAPIATTVAATTADVATAVAATAVPPGPLPAPTAEPTATKPPTSGPGPAKSAAPGATAAAPSAPTPTPTPTPTANSEAAAVPVVPVPVPTTEPAPQPKEEPIAATVLPVVSAPVATRAESSAAAVPATPAATAPPPPPPAEQLVAVLRPLERAGDGTYHLRLELRPPELGRVDLRVELRDGVFHAAIHTEHANTAELVRGALDDLRSRLDAEGVRSGALTVDNGSAQTPERERENAQNAPAADIALPTPTTDLSVTSTETTSDSLLDVRI